MTEPVPEYLVGRIQQALATDPRTGELELDVRVAGRRVFLTGTVVTAERRVAVEEVVREIARGYQVMNELSVIEEPGPGGDEVVR